MFLNSDHFSPFNAVWFLPYISPKHFKLIHIWDLPIFLASAMFGGNFLKPSFKAFIKFLIFFPKLFCKFSFLFSAGQDVNFLIKFLFYSFNLDVLLVWYFLLILHSPHEIISTVCDFAYKIIEKCFQ